MLLICVALLSVCLADGRAIELWVGPDTKGHGHPTMCENNKGYAYPTGSISTQFYVDNPCERLDTFRAGVDTIINVDYSNKIHKAGDRLYCVEWWRSRKRGLNWYWQYRYEVRCFSQACPAGFYCPGSSAAAGEWAYPCKAGTMQGKAGQSSCEQCPAMTACPGWHLYGNWENDRARCKDDISKMHWSPSCQRLHVQGLGYDFGESARSVYTCNVNWGTFNNDKGAVGCHSCHGNMAIVGHSGAYRCDYCPQGWYKSGFFCHQCPLTSHTTFSHGQTGCMCNAGHYRVDHSWPIPGCTICPSGHFCPGTRDDDRVYPCAGGQYSPAGSTGCSQCELGKYSLQDAGSLGQCTSCGIGQRLASNRRGCVACHLGSIPTNHYTQCIDCGKGQISAGNACVDCTPGKYTDLGNNVCVDCSVDTASTGGGAGSCPPCPTNSNTRGSTGQSRCEWCDEGMQRYAGECVPCPAGTHSVEDASKCVPCGINQFSGVAMTSCSHCGDDSVSTPKRDGCDLCEDGTIPTPEGTCECPRGLFGKPCVGCMPGTFRVEGFGSNCVLCPFGTFSAVESATSCTSCANGTSTLFKGAGSPEDCRSLLCKSCTGENELAVCDLVYPTGETCLRFEDNNIGGSCPKDWFSDPTLIEGALYDGSRLLTRPTRVLVDPSGRYVAVLAGNSERPEPDDAKMVAIYTFTDPGAMLSNRLLAPFREAPAGVCYEDMVWTIDGRYLMAFTR